MEKRFLTDAEGKRLQLNRGDLLGFWARASFFPFHVFCEFRCYEILFMQISLTLFLASRYKLYYTYSVHYLLWKKNIIFFI